MNTPIFVVELYKERSMKKISILGSCVSRDLFDNVTDYKLNYFARSSLISLVAKPIEIDEHMILNFESPS